LVQVNRYFIKLLSFYDKINCFLKDIDKYNNNFEELKWLESQEKVNRYLINLLRAVYILKTFINNSNSITMILKNELLNKCINHFTYKLCKIEK